MIKPYFETERGVLYQGNALDVLKDMEPESIDCVMTSPPYWALRDYGIEPEIWDGDGDCKHEWGNEYLGDTRPYGAGLEIWQKGAKGSEHIKISQGNICIKCGAWKGSLGLEPTFQLYIQHLIQIFDEIKKVLKKTGTCWVNIGDTYGTHTGKRSGQFGNNIKDGFDDIYRRNRLPQTVGEKSLCQIPERFSIAMTDNDNMDIYELDNSFIKCNIIDDKTGEVNAIQRPHQSERIQYEISAEVERTTQRSISANSSKMVQKPQNRSLGKEKSVLLATSGAGNSKSYERECKETSSIKNRSDNTLWRRSTEMCLLRGDKISISNNTSYKEQWESTQEGNSKQILFNIRMVKENELSRRFQRFMYELQLGKREIWILPPSGRRNICFRKRDIPVDLLPFFKLYKQERWLKRNTIVWEKPNCMPSSADDRFTVDFEYLYFFVKNQKYWFEQQFEKLSDPLRTNFQSGKRIHGDNKDRNDNDLGNRSKDFSFINRNKRCVWKIATQPFPEAHFAVYPEQLCYTPIKAGCPEYICKKCGKARKKIYEKQIDIGREQSNTKYDIENDTAGRLAQKRQAYRKLGFENPPSPKFLSYSDCECGEEFEPGIVLDPFAGAGTTLLVAEKLGRKHIGIEINLDYIKIAQERIKKETAQYKMDLTYKDGGKQ